MKKNHNQVQQSKKKTDYSRLTLKKISRKENERSTQSVFQDKEDVKPGGACLFSYGSGAQWQSQLHETLYQKEEKQKQECPSYPSQGQTGPTVPCLLQHFLKNEEILNWGMKWEQEHPQGQEAEILKGPNSTEAAVLSLPAMYTTCLMGRTCRIGRIPQGQAGHGSVCCGETLLDHEEILF